MNREDLKEMFSMDSELIEKYHLRAGEGLEVCVDDTWNIIKDIELQKTDYGYFAVDTKSDVVPWLVGFFIKPDMRTGDTMKRFWKDVYEKFNSPFCTGVYNKNLPAIKFLSKQGNVMSKDDLNTVFYFLKEKR